MIPPRTLNEPLPETEPALMSRMPPPEPAPITRERVVYDETQLEGFIASELPDNVEQARSCCCGGPAAADQVKEITQALLGKIWSAKIHARKPE